ncbi:nucleotidyltransferase family protein [Methylotenera sp. G11]|uniref:nucleotidyltransferase family protein n=1 Tax=Methylotenera sp. G11 TaxID=1506585 RepID=UPI0006491243|nr:nucleotidyltransferase family protein [Methylotenera sp. G11]
MIGILLAAGFSRRFGSTDKLLHPLEDGRPIALVAAENLVTAIPLTIAVLRPDNQALAGLLERAGLKIVFCDPQQTGMADSLSYVVRYSSRFDESGTGFVVALADMPYISQQTIRAVAQELTAGAGIVAPICKGQRGHPVGFSAKFRSELEQLTGDEGARAILKRHADQVKLLECGDAGILADIDTLADLAVKPHT